MAERRMFSKKVTDDDAFMLLSSAAQALYLHLSMNADDDGFCNQVSICMFRAHASVKDLESLLTERYIYQFENGVIVIKHWRMANALRKDRYNPTIFKKEMAQLDLDDTGEYNLKSENSSWLPDGCQVVAKRLPQVRLGKDRIGQDRIGQDRIDSSVEAEPEYLEPLNYNMEVLDGVSEEGKRYEEEVLLPAEEKKHTIFPAEELESTITELAPVESVILNDNSEWIPTVEEYEEYKRLYPNVDIDQEFRKIHGWCKDNPKKRKTRTGVKRFVGGWLSREQDKPRAGNSVPSWKRQDTLSDFYNADPDRQGSGEKVTDDDIAEFQKMLSQMSGS
jgi:hypothetical protein